MTNIIGNKEANAIIPKPSTIGLRPRIEEARPTPRAVTSGTVSARLVPNIMKKKRSIGDGMPTAYMPSPFRSAC
jgi:hypothetical protein